MATPRERPWSNDEKNSLLAEIIKASSPPHGVLLNVVRSLGINQQLPWEDMMLPYGRTLSDCQRLFADLMRQTPQPAPLGLYGTPTAGPSMHVKRSLPEGPQYSGGREIRPKPTPTPSYGPPSAGEGPAKRKRGRPTNASLAAKRAEEDARAAQAGPATPTQLTTPLAQISPIELGPVLPPSRPEDRAMPSNVPGRMHIGSILTTTPEAQRKTSSHSSSSSGKRRRMRLMRADEESTTPAIIRGQDLPQISTTTGFGESSIPRHSYSYGAEGDPGTPSRSSPRVTQPPLMTHPGVSQPPTSRP